MKTRHLIFLSIILFMAGCGGDGAAPVKIDRFEQLLFSTPAERLGQVLTESYETYNSPLLNLHPSESGYMEMLLGFVGDPVVRRIYSVTDSLYHDLSWLEQDLGNALHRAGKEYPGMVFRRFYTLLTADFQDYDSRVFCHDGDMAISIDRYAIGALGEMQYFGMPSYLVQLCSRDYILADCMSAAVREHIALPDGEMTYLDYAVAEGKVMYFLKKTLPEVDDTILLRYTTNQLDWMRSNTEHVWSWLIGNNVLYTTDHAQLRNLVDNAPRTNAFGAGSAPRTNAYIGWQIVDRYMRRTSASMEELLGERDSRKILTESGWRP